MFSLARYAAMPLLLGASLLAQGPLVLMGIDAEDGGPGGHGPITVYVDVVNSMLSSALGGSNILVIGGGKSPTDSVTTFWNAIDAAIPTATVTYANGAAVGTQSFAGFRLVAIVSDFINTPSGGLTNAENTLLTGRAADVQAHVNGGGGLLGFSSNALAVPYGYLGSIGAFTFATPAQFQDITPTAAGLAIGITNALDICCWHDEYITFPGFLQVLATNATTGNPCAIGGSQVIIVQGIVLTPTAGTACVGTNHVVTATVADNLGNPVVGTNVAFDVIAGPNTGVNGNGVTNAAGQATFTYSSAVPGVDTVQACFVNSSAALVCTTATVTWVPLPFFDAPSPCGQVLNASVGVPISFTVTAKAVTGLPGNQISLNAAGTPAGATHTPPLPVVDAGPAATATTVFDWTPLNSQVGNHVITYTATDNCGQSVTCVVTINVAECFLFLGFQEGSYAFGPEPDDVLRLYPVVWYPVTMTQIPQLFIPNNAALMNLNVAAQVGMFNPEIYPTNPLQLSNGLRLTIGVGTQQYGQISGVTLTGNPVPVLGNNYTFAFTIQ